MASDEAVDYVNKALAAGYSKEQIAQNLLGGGWTQQDIDEALAAAPQPSAKPASIAATSTATPSQPGQPTQATQPKKGRWKLIAAAVILIIAIVASGIYYMNQNASPAEQTTNTSEVNISSATPSVAASSGLASCGKSLDCMISYVDSCTPASATIESSRPAAIDSDMNLTDYLELRKSAEAGNCTLYLRFDKVEFAYSQKGKDNLKAMNKTDAEIAALEAQMRAVLESMMGKDGTCTYATSDLKKILNNWKAGSFSTNDYKNATCTGPMFAAT